MLTSSNAAQSLFDNQKNLIASGKGFILSQNAIADALQSMTVKAKLAEIGVKALRIAENALISLGIGLAIQGVYGLGIS